MDFESNKVVPVAVVGAAEGLLAARHEDESEYCRNSVLDETGTLRHAHMTQAEEEYIRSDFIPA